MCGEELNKRSKAVGGTVQLLLTVSLGLGFNFWVRSAVSLWVVLNSKGGGSWWNPVQLEHRMVVNTFSMLGGLDFGQGVFWEIEMFSRGHSLMTFLRANS